MKKRYLLMIFIVVMAIAIAAAYSIFGGEKPIEVKWITTTVTEQTITQSITATGTVEPVTQVDVGTQVSGILTHLYVDYNSVVTKGQVIAELDKSTLLLDRNSKQNSVNAAQSKFNYLEANFKRVKGLYEKELIADSEYELALYDYQTAKNDLDIAKNNLELAETNLGYATIYSPIDGVILSKAVEQGQTVASSFSTPTLFTVAADLSDMQVVVSVDEADIGYVADGQRAAFTVDAFPLDSFSGVVTQVRQEPIEESNVITYEVVISAPNPDLQLKPGLTASVEIFTLEAECEAAVSVAALTFSPPKREGELRPNRPGATDGSSTVWVLSDDMITPREVTVGVSNGIITELFGVEVGTELVTGAESPMPEGKGAPQGGSDTNPFAPQRPGGNRR